jgi:FkbM family methyltransferase
MEDLIADHTGPGQASDADAPALAFEYPKEAIISYAQTREDVLLWRALHNVHYGFYIDVGAHDPTALSVTRAFYDHGWHGINVEPDPTYAEKLRTERPRDVTLEVALGHRPGMATFYEFGEPGLSTLVEEIAQEHMAGGFKAREHRVPVTTLAALLDDLGGQQVHFLKIDVEGDERQVLRGADFAKVRPWIVLIEATRPLTPVPSYRAWEPLLLEADYEFAYFDGLNRFYISKEHTSLGRYFSIPVNIFDRFRDGEVVQLSGAVAELERDKLEQASFVARLEVRTHELSSAVTRAEFVQHQWELEAENAKYDAAAAREEATELQNLVLRLHAELRRFGEEQVAQLQLAKKKAAELQLAKKQVAELQRSRWRRLGLLLGLARKASFER